MRKFLISHLFLLACQAGIHAQNVQNLILENKKRDSLKIEALKMRLQVVKDTARIDCLNEIAETFLKWYSKTDSTFFYADIANREALQTGYKNGETQALIILANLKYRYFYDTTECERYVKRALPLAIELNDDLLIGKSYLQLGHLENPAENYQKSMYYFKKTGNIKLETEATIRLCMEEMERGRYESSFSHCQNCVELAWSNVKKDTTDDWAYEMVAWSYMNMYDLYEAAGDHETALDYALKAKKYAEDKNVQGWFPYDQLNELYINMGKLDSALFYWNLMKKDYDNTIERGRIVVDNRLAQIHLKKNQPDSALPILENSLEKSLSLQKKMTNKWDEWPLLNTLFLQAEAYSQKKEYNRALPRASKAVEGFERHNSRGAMMNGYQLLSSVYYHLRRHKDAYETLVKYQTIRDSIQTRQFLIRLNNYKREAEDAKKESRIGYLQRDNQIKQQQLKQQAIFRNFIVAIFIAVLFVGLYVYRNIRFKRKNERLQHRQKEQEWKMQQLESENKHSELQRRAVELEMQALRAQMNPHFIFNCLSSINRFILKNEGKVASTYLTRFSRLMRMVLMNSQKQLITLEDELQTLELYLEMERLRFQNSFDYSITLLNAIDRDHVFIPPLLLQPFCENAIWHGLMHKDGHGRLDIELSMKDNILNCTIKDNGVGREKSEEMNSRTAEKKKSMGLKITAGRLALLNSEREMQTFYEIEDLKDDHGVAAGTKVTVQISFRETTEKPVHVI